MKARYFLAALAFLATPFPSEAQIKVEMNNVTCGDWVGYSRDQQEFVRFWMSGYYSAAANNAVLDYNRLQKNAAKIASYCKKHKSETLPKAINANLK
jgi:acid stress chaperone HdeB